MEGEKDCIGKFSITEEMFCSSKLVGDRLNSIEKFNDWFGWVIANIVEVAVKVEMV